MPKNNPSPSPVSAVMGRWPWTSSLILLGETSMGADIVTLPLDDVGVAGALHDPLAALFFCQVPRVGHSVVDGRMVLRDGQLATLELRRHVERHNRLAAAPRVWKLQRPRCRSALRRSVPACPSL